MIDRFPRQFVNRESELKTLESAWETPTAQLITIWGRRRVGKSALLSRFASAKRALYLYGTRATEQDILRNFSDAAATAFGQEYLRSNPFRTWDPALEFLAAQAREQRLLVIFDEFPYMCEATQGLDTLVQRWWDLTGQNANLMLVIAGSAFSFMAGLTGYEGALHGRRTGQLTVEPFDYFDAALLYSHLEPTDRVRAYACFGGIPAYLQFWRTTWQLDHAIRSTLLRPGHILFHEGEELLRTEFHQETVYASILRAVANGEERPSDIARAVARGGVSEIIEQLRRLQDLHILRREVPITERHFVRSRRVLYRLADPYLRFWYRFVAPHQSAIQLGKSDEIWHAQIEPRFDEFVARTTWEEVCVQYLWRAMRAKRVPVLSEIGRWWDKDNEIDVVGLIDGKAKLIGECKWTNAAVDERVLSRLQQKSQALDIADDPIWVLFSRSGFSQGLQQRAESENLLLITPEDMYQSELAVS